MLKSLFASRSVLWLRLTVAEIRVKNKVFPPKPVVRVVENFTISYTHKNKFSIANAQPVYVKDL